MQATLPYVTRWWKKPSISKIVLTLIYSDFLFISAGGIISPIFAVFITNQINGGSLSVVGLSTLVFWVVKSAVQVPVAWYVDRTRGERDDYLFMIVGVAISAVIPMLYYFFVREAWHVYAVEALNGVGYAFQVPTWLAIFTRHIDKNKESTEWTMHSNTIGLGFAFAAAIGGFLADRYGLRVLFPMVSALMLVGAVILLFIREDIIKGDIANGFTPS